MIELENDYSMQKNENLNLSTSQHVAPKSIGIGPTDILSLRVSASFLTLFIIKSGDYELGLFERVIKINEAGQVQSQLQPIGGAAGILNCFGFEEKIGVFNFDSEAAAKETDLRIFVNPDNWPKIRNFLQETFTNKSETHLIENSPLREIQEEIGDLLGIEIKPTSFVTTRVDCYFQDTPRISKRGGDVQTVRAFAVDELHITDSSLANQIIDYCLHNDYQKQLATTINKGKIKSSGLCLLPINPIVETIARLNPEDREKLIPHGDQTLANNVYATVLHRIVP